MTVKPKIIGIVAVPFASISDYLKFLDSSGFLNIDLNKVAAEILKEEFSLSNLEEEEISSHKDKIWAIYGKSYLVNKAVTDWIPWVESHAEVNPGFYNFAVSNIETIEEVKYLQSKFSDEFRLVGIITPRIERLERFKDVTKQDTIKYNEIEERVVRTNFCNTLLMADLIVTKENDFETIKKIL